MRVAIVGSGGFIGQKVADALAQRHIDVVAISSKSADVFDSQTGIFLDREPSTDPIDAMVYLSQSPHYRDVPRQAPHLWSVNVVSAVKAGEWARRSGARRIIHASSGNVYRPSFSANAEGTPIRRDDWYALSKVQAEDALRLLPGVSVTSARLFSVYGPGQRSKLIPNLVRAIMTGGPVRLQAHPSDARDAGGLRLSLTYIDDLVRVFLHLVTAGGPPVLNVAGPEVLSIRDIAETIGRRLGVEPSFTVDPEPRPCDLIADASLASTLAGGGYSSFATGIATTVDELRSDS